MTAPCACNGTGLIDGKRCWQCRGWKTPDRSPPVPVEPPTPVKPKRQGRAADVIATRDAALLSIVAEGWVAGQYALAKRLGWSKGETERSIKRLIADGRIVRPRLGVYRAVKSGGTA